ncbi:DNA repair ATPase [Labilibacter marinus]|uniref:DNA repair ATPase n=1 Tax=Labilibacter marinus TaxID=1477105 RepID=UPI0009501066|nr:DNA repair ATPase [Labilibacter marinus]
MATTTPQDTNENTAAEPQLEQGTYEIIRSRLNQHGKQLQSRLNNLNEERKGVFGSIETTLIGSERITTANNCIPVDMVTIGNSFIFGYNVIIGLKKEVDISDVFSVYGYNAEEHNFHEESLELLISDEFEKDFKNLYKYYKETQFIKFGKIGPSLFLVFKTGKGKFDIKTFKFLIKGNTIEYVDNRSDHEFVFPDQHEFKWTRTTRDMHVKGQFPHISIEEQIFVETTEGDLTIKVENNTDSGLGIYAEEVEHKTQTLDDAEFYYSIIENLIVLKIKPYQEEQFRYIVYNKKMQEAVRIDSLEDSCVLLPDSHGLIFANGYYLQTGEIKIFDNELTEMIFLRRIPSPNGEDYLYIFYNQTRGDYVLLSYNLIAQQVETPVICNGYSLFENGEICFMKTDGAPKKHHALQIWKTPYLDSNYQLETESNQTSFLYKIGNKDIVRGMSECNEVLKLIQKEDSYANLYFDIQKTANDILDSYYWIGNEEAANLQEPLLQIKETAGNAIDEYDKVVSIKKNSAAEVTRVMELISSVTKKIKDTSFSAINEYVDVLAELRTLRGETISLKELRYVDVAHIESEELKLEEFNQEISNNCVQFLLKPEALEPYSNKVEELKGDIKEVKKVVKANDIEEELSQTSGELEMLIEIVSNLKIDDATETTRIIDNISTIYSSFNQVNAALKRKRKELLSLEGTAEFNAQIKLISQGLTNYLELSDSPEKCIEFQTKLMVQIEELEGKFSEFDEFIDKISTKRDEIYNSFESKKISLVEARNKRANTLFQSSERILKAIQNRVSKFGDVSEINGYYASDLMIEKLRNIVSELIELEDSVKADSIQSQLKTVKEEAIRQLKDKTELYVDGENIIKFGEHKFSVNTQPCELTMVYKGEEMFFHLTGTNFYENVKNEQFYGFKDLWDQSIPSENTKVYRAEYLAYKVFVKCQQEFNGQLIALKDDDILKYIRDFMAQRYNEGYVKGVHDMDAFIVVKELIELLKTAGLLKYSTQARACAVLFWNKYASAEVKESYYKQLKGVGALLEIFPDAQEFQYIVDGLKVQIAEFINKTELFNPILVDEAAEYFFHEVVKDENFVIDSEAADLYKSFIAYLKDKKANDFYQQSIEELNAEPVAQYKLIKKWLSAFMSASSQTNKTQYTDEVAVLLMLNCFNKKNIVKASLRKELEGFQGTHNALVDGKYSFDYNQFILKLKAYEKNTALRFADFTALKKDLIQDFEEELRLEEFKPRVLSSFVRNKLIDKVYLPLVGDNLAKQLGAAGEGKRTDLMGMLLLISPPGYGKTTLMEYIASRLGIIFMKINGPAIGHEVTSLDPAEAGNASAREELKKLNLSFEMGDNVMIYLDDIQHCNPEFLQKFISLCDAQRKIEGIYKGRSKTYDFRGRKVCVVMAGNPYTESGDKFQIPDMLANRADIYNLGDILGDTADVFNMSYIENSLTSNKVLNQLAAKSHNDIYPMLKLADSGNKEGLEFEASHTQGQINDYVNILKKLMVIRDVISKVNQQYIESAAQAEEYRTEPAFKLQGSYRNMNKITEKIVTIMNDDELETLILSHYEGESQTLTSGAEANMLKFKEIVGKLSDEEVQRWDDIKATFQKNMKLKAGGSSQAAQVLEGMVSVTESINNVSETLKKCIWNS